MTERWQIEIGRWQRDKKVESFFWRPANRGRISQWTPGGIPWKSGRNCCRHRIIHDNVLLKQVANKVDLFRVRCHQSGKMLIVSREQSISRPACSISKYLRNYKDHCWINLAVKKLVLIVKCWIKPIEPLFRKHMLRLRFSHLNRIWGWGIDSRRKIEHPEDDEPGLSMRPWRSGKFSLENGHK